MAMPEAIIVYRNPAEAMMWSALMTPEAFAIFAGLAVGFIGLLSASWGLSSITYWNSPLRTWIPLTVGAASWVGVTWWLWL
jgi:hypothetical protein